MTEPTLIRFNRGHPPYNEGECAQFDEANAARLVRAGVAVYDDGRTLDPEDPAEPVELDEERLVQITALIETLDPEDESHFTSAGKPKTTALAELLGESVTAAERDAAFERFKSGQAPEGA